MFIQTCESIESVLNRYRGMNVLRNTFFDYNIALNRILEARHRRTSSQTCHFPITNSTKVIGESDTRSIFSCSPSPPLATATAAIDSTSKSFTIDAILGLNSESNGGNGRPINTNTALDFSNSSTDRKFSRVGSEKSSRDVKSNGKMKRVRTIFTPEQLERLEAEFERQQYMVGPERLYLAHTLHLTEAQVKVWFQNRRIKWRKQHLEMTQQRLDILKQHREQKLRQMRQRCDSNADDSE